MNFQEVARKATITIRRFLNRNGIRNKKVFAIGFNKSASTSLHTLFESLGHPSYHGNKWRDHNNQSVLKKYDCFSDDIPIDMVALDQLFPKSKFILNVRDLESWIYSRLAHIEHRKRTRQNYHTGPKWDTSKEAIKSWIEQRNDYHLFVLSYFSDRPADLLVVNFVRDQSAATKVCQFLGYKGEYRRPMENINPNSERPQHHRELLQRSIREMEINEIELTYDLYCPSIERGASPFPPDSRELKVDQTFQRCQPG
ncbi:hypothetical protein BOW53_08020 [Solemya pervernicosa gill symbiont]|uniref:Sulfotransferase domain-containing protein n=2 Tax=Gammaproteobacteria incertae sedis TaxID=118884 RepID=A0A1T2L5M5_9GAMM|nr:sulfotransferase [Candidatus Reidiella endopervernicosa]OOZ40407.1 hypothetical protein BOW53_08020 [Solemya pervernicosa gill symbiont]QKQ25549.1 hypothetical protein HUE57_03970 [Candidatus Reidiella endopervernicosa]